MIWKRDIVVKPDCSLHLVWLLEYNVPIMSTHHPTLQGKYTNWNEWRK